VVLVSVEDLGGRFRCWDPQDLPAPVSCALSIRNSRSTVADPRDSARGTSPRALLLLCLLFAVMGKSKGSSAQVRATATTAPIAGLPSADSGFRALEMGHLESKLRASLAPTHRWFCTIELAPESQAPTVAADFNAANFVTVLSCGGEADVHRPARASPEATLHPACEYAARSVGLTLQGSMGCRRRSV